MATPESIIKKFSKFETLPHVAIRLTKMIAENEGSTSDYEEVIKYDPALVMRLFRLANSAYYSMDNKIEDISEAVTMVGLDNLRNLVVAEALKGIFKGNVTSGTFSRTKLWSHCVATGICCRMIADRVFNGAIENAFLCGLLHDVGIIVEDQVMPGLMETVVNSLDAGVRFIDQERMVIGANHCETGFWLAREWKLPAVVQFGIRDHHNRDTSPEPSSITGILQLAEAIVAKAGFTALPEMQSGLQASLLKHMGEHIEIYKTIIADLPEELRQAYEVYSDSK